MSLLANIHLVGVSLSKIFICWCYRYNPCLCCTLWFSLTFSAVTLHSSVSLANVLIFSCLWFIQSWNLNLPLWFWPADCFHHLLSPCDLLPVSPAAPRDLISVEQLVNIFFFACVTVDVWPCLPLHFFCLLLLRLSVCLWTLCNISLSWCIWVSKYKLMPMFL